MDKKEAVKEVKDAIADLDLFSSPSDLEGEFELVAEAILGRTRWGTMNMSVFNVEGNTIGVVYEQGSGDENGAVEPDYWDVFPVTGMERIHYEKDHTYSFVE